MYLLRNAVQGTEQKYQETRNYNYISFCAIQ